MRATPRTASTPDLHLSESELQGIFVPAPRRAAAPVKRHDSLLDFSQIRTTPASALATADEGEDERTNDIVDRPRAPVLSRSWLVAAGLAVGVLVALGVLAAWTVSRPAPPRPAPRVEQALQLAAADEEPLPGAVEISVDDEPTIAAKAPVKVRATPAAKKSRRTSRH